MHRDRRARPLYALPSFHVAVVIVSLIAAWLASLGLDVLVDTPEASALAEVIADRVTAGSDLLSRCIEVAWNF